MRRPINPDPLGLLDDEDALHAGDEVSREGAEVGVAAGFAGALKLTSTVSPLPALPWTPSECGFSRCPGRKTP